MLRFAVASNVVNVFYIILFDLFLPVFLAWLIHVFLTSWNLKIIYQDRKPLKLRQLCIPTLIDQGLSQIAVTRILALLSTVTLVLAMAGGFAITGVSRQVLRERPVALLVDGGSQLSALNFTNHVSEDGTRVSSSFLLIESAQGCLSQRKNGVRIYSAFNDLKEIEVVKWPKGTQIANTTCRLEKNGFEEKVALGITFMEEPLDMSNCQIDVVENKDAKLAQAVGGYGGNCPFQLLETWCSTYRKSFCVMLLKVGSHFTTATMEFSKNESVPKEILFNAGEWMVSSMLNNQRMESMSLRNMVFLLSCGSVTSVSWARSMGMLSILRNAKIGEYEEVKETLIDERLMTAMAGTALGLITVFGAITYFIWVRFVVKPGRRKYNGFSSPSDMLSCAVVETKNTGNCRFKGEDRATIVLRNGEPHLV